MNNQCLRLVVQTDANTVFNRVIEPGRITIGRQTGCTIVIEGSGAPDECWIFAGNVDRGWSLVFRVDDDLEFHDPDNDGTTLTASNLFAQATRAGDLHFFPLKPNAFGLFRFGRRVVAFSVEGVAAETCGEQTAADDRSALEAVVMA